MITLHLWFEANNKATSLPSPIQPPVIKTLDDGEMIFGFLKIFLIRRNPNKHTTIRKRLNPPISKVVR